MIDDPPVDLTDGQMHLRIAHAIELRGVKQSAIAALFKQSRQSVSYWLRPKGEGGTVPPADKLIRLARYLSVDTHWLLTGEGHPDRRGKASNVEYDERLMADLIEAVETALISQQKTLVPRKKADLICTAYNYFLNTGNVDLDQLRRLIQLTD